MLNLRESAARTLTAGPGFGLLGPSRKGLWVAAALAGLGAAICVGGLEVASTLDRLPYWQIPFITSIALVMGAPDSAPAQPRALIGGHVVSTLAGYLLLWLFGANPVAAAFAVGLAVLAMLRLKVFHPPAAVDAFLVVNLGLGLAFLVNPVILGAVLLVAFGFLWRRVGRRRPQVSASSGRPLSG